MRRMAILTAILTLAAASGTLASAVPVAAAGQAPENRPARGLVFDGLQPGGAGGPCAGGFEMRVGGATLCTNGPDAGPRGLDVRTRRSVAQLRLASQSLAAAEGTSTAGESVGGVPVIGDGTSGNRVLAMYVVAADRPDRYAQVAPLIAGWAAYVDSMMNASAALTGGERHIRFVTDTAGALVVAKVVLPADGDDSIANTINYLKALGYNDPARKYLMWADASVYCGVATVSADDRPTQDNRNNGLRAMYARIDQGCWGSTNSVELHELVHNLGGVQLSAPHSSGGYHCTDEYDRMCYRDSSAVQMTYTCPSGMEKYLDCGGDDYFSTSPPAGSYLATHWNVADSSFLHAGPPDGTTPPPTTPPANQAPRVTASGPGTVTLPGVAALNGTVTDDGLVGPYTVAWSQDSGPGPVAFANPAAEDTTAAFSAPGIYRLRLTADDGGLTGTATLTVTVADQAPPPGPAVTTAVFTGNLNKKFTARSFVITAAEGPAQAVLSFGGGASSKKPAAALTLRLYDPTGALLATASGSAPVEVSLPLPIGRYTWEVSGDQTSFSLQVTYLKP